MGLIFILVTESLQAQEVGDRVVVTANFETKIYKKKVDQVFEGSIHTVIAVNGKWCAISDIKGWLPKQYVMNLPMAKKMYDKRLRDNPRDAYAFAHRGMIQMEGDKLNEALQDLNKAYQLMPNNLLTLINIGKVLHAQGRYVEGVRVLEQVIARDKKFPYAYFNLGMNHFGMNQNQKAIEAFNEAILLKPENPWFYLSRGSAKMNQGDSEGAMKDYDKSLELDAKMADALVGKSNVYLSRDEYKTALEFANKAVKAQPKNAMALNARGWLYYRQENFDDAIFDFNAAIRYAPKLPVSYNNRGVVYAAKKLFDKAVKDYSQAILLSRAAPVTFVNRGTAYLGAGDFQNAKTDLEKAVALSPELPEANHALAWFLATCPDQKYRNGKLALEKAKFVCEKDSEPVWNHLDTLAASHAEVGDFKNAVTVMKQALDAAPEDEKADCQKRLSQYEAGKPWRSQVGKTFPRRR